MVLTLYYAPLTCSLASYIALTEAGADFDIIAIDFARRDHMAPEFLRLNPKHKVPVLVIDGEVLTESVAIQLWIADQFPGAQLLPDRGIDRYRAISLLSFFASSVHASLAQNGLTERYCDLPNSAESVRRCAHRLMTEHFGVLNDILADREWFFDRFMLPDIYFFWTFRRGQSFGIDPAAYPNCKAHFDRMLMRPSVQKLIAFEASTLAAFKHEADTTPHGPAFRGT